MEAAKANETEDLHTDWQTRCGCKSQPIGNAVQAELSTKRTCHRIAVKVGGLGEGALVEIMFIPAGEPPLHSYHRREVVLPTAIIFVISGGCFWSAWYIGGVLIGVLLVCFVGLLAALIGFMFSYMTVQDEGDRLSVGFGPLAFGTRIRYDEITHVDRGVMTLFDGIGIHTNLQGAGSYNPGTRDCVAIHLKNRSTVRIGTSDVEGLCRFLEGRIEANRPR